jgi:hypothetical protein
VAGRNGEETKKLLTEASSNQGQVESQSKALVTLVGYELHRSAMMIRATLAENKMISKEFENSHWFEGEHSLRFTVQRENSAYIVDHVHASLIE